MDLEQQLRAALAPAKPDARLRAAVMSRVSGAARKASGKASSRIIFGTVLIAVAAAAMLSAFLLKSPPPPMIASAPSPEKIETAVVAAENPAEQVSEPQEETSSRKVRPPGKEKPLPRLLPPKRTVPAPPDSATAERAMVARYPDLVNGPENDTITAVTITLKADGSVHGSDIKSMPMGSDARVPPPQISDLMSMMSNIGSASTRRTMRKGTILADGAILKGTVALTFTVLPDGFDGTRTVDLVHKALLTSHPDLLLPLTAQTFNQLTVFMTEDGKIDRYYVRNGPQTNLRPYGDFVPERFATEWEPLGLKPEQLGLMGITKIYEGIAPQRAPIPVVPRGPTGSADVADVVNPVLAVGDPSTVYDLRWMVVRYAWPRREGEPIGGFNASVQPTNLSVGGALFSHAEAAAVIDHYLPGALNDTGVAPMGTPALVMNREGEVVHSGYIKPEMGQRVDAQFLETQNAGLRIAEVLQMTIVKKYGAAYSDRVIFAWLAP